MTKLLRAVVCALALCCCCAHAAAQQQQQPASPPAAPAPEAERDDADEGPCPKAMSQHEMNRCASEEFQKADAELNKLYRQLTGGAGAGERAKLRAAQLAWIKFRDAHCDYEAFGNTGGSIYPMVHGFCRARVTRERASQFKEILKEAEER